MEQLLNLRKALSILGKIEYPNLIRASQKIYYKLLNVKSISFKNISKTRLATIVIYIQSCTVTLHTLSSTSMDSINHSSKKKKKIK